MPNLRKVDGNGAPPGCPQDANSEAKTLDQALREESENEELRDVQRARRFGLSESYTKAPWRDGLNK
jgi:hypothetical protein